MTLTVGDALNTLTKTPIFDTHSLSFDRTLFKESKLWLYIDFSLTVKAAPHACVIRTGQP